MPEQEPVENKPDYKEHWHYMEVPEENIRALAIEQVALQVGLTEEWVRRIHDFQWALVYETVEANKTVMLPKIGRFLMRENELESAIELTAGKLIKLEVRLDHHETKKYFDKTKQNKEFRRNAITKLREQIKDLDKEMEQYKKLKETKTQKAYAARFDRSNTGTK